MPSPWLMREIRAQQAADYAAGRTSNTAQGMLCSYAGWCKSCGCQFPRKSWISRHPSGSGWCCGVCSGFEREEYEGGRA